MTAYKKKEYPVHDIRTFLEPSPALLVSSAHGSVRNIMTMGWYTVMEFSPSLVGTIISAANYTFDLLVESKECVLNIPSIELSDKVVAIGNSTGSEVDKFEAFQLTPQQAKQVKAPLIKECFANFECKLHDGKLVEGYNFFIWEVVEAHVAVSPQFPETIHYRGDSIFMTSGKNITIPSLK